MDDDLAPVWRALGNPLRRSILDALRRGPMTTGALAELLPHVTRFAVMQHLGVLEEAQLVVVRREGRERWNFLNAVPIRRIYERWVSKYDDVVAADLTALKRRIESPPRASPVSRRSKRKPVKERTT